MSFVTTQPEMLAVSAGHLAGVGSAVAEQNSATAAPITAVLPAGADQVSVLTAAQFASYGHMYQLISSQADTILDLFVTTLRESAGSYALTEAANAFVAGG